MSHSLNFLCFLQEFIEAALKRKLQTAADCVITSLTELPASLLLSIAPDSYTTQPPPPLEIHFALLCLVFGVNLSSLSWENRNGVWITSPRTWQEEAALKPRFRKHDGVSGSRFWLTAKDALQEQDRLTLNDNEQQGLCTCEITISAQKPVSILNHPRCTHSPSSSMTGAARPQVNLYHCWTTVSEYLSQRQQHWNTSKSKD